MARKLCVEASGAVCHILNCAMGIVQETAADNSSGVWKKRRAQEDSNEWKAIKRAWCLGDATFRQELLEHNGRSDSRTPSRS
jgi:hypothetical protein